MKLHHEITYDGDANNNPINWMKPQERGAYFALSHNRYDLAYEIETTTDEFLGWAELAKNVTSKKGELPGYQYKFVRWYEHGGIAVSLVDTDEIGGWNVGCAGVIFGKTQKDIELAFAPYRDYIQGDIYQVTIKNENGETLDALGGIYGYDSAVHEADEMMAQAKIEVDRQEKRDKQRAKEIKQAQSLAKKHGYILAKEV